MHCLSMAACCAEGKLQGCACLGSGYDFGAEMAKASRPGTMSLQYCNAINAYWKAYLKEHSEVLKHHSGIDFAAAKRASSLQVRLGQPRIGQQSTMQMSVFVQ